MRRLLLPIALLFALPTYAVEIDWVTVGDPGNESDDPDSKNRTEGTT